MHIHPIEAFSDNYIWLIEEGNEVIVVDPGEAESVLAYLENRSLDLKAILLTHKHDDHIGGVAELMREYPKTPVYGPKEVGSLVDHLIYQGDSFELMEQRFEVFKTAGHTEGHISLLMGEALFCGDAMFSGGCGRVFTGDYAAQFDAMQKFSQLDDAVQVYAGHEYTQTNLRFAQTVQPSNEAIAEALATADELRAQDLPTLPSTIGQEKRINLFLQAETLEEFTELRKGRDEF